MSWLTVVQNFATFIEGQFVTIIIAVCVVLAAIESMVTKRWSHFYSVFGAAAIAVSAAWAVTTFYGGGEAG